MKVYLKRPSLLQRRLERGLDPLIPCSTPSAAAALTAAAQHINHFSTLPGT